MAEENKKRKAYSNEDSDSDGNAPRNKKGRRIALKTKAGSKRAPKKASHDSHNAAKAAKLEKDDDAILREFHQNPDSLPDELPIFSPPTIGAQNQAAIVSSAKKSSAVPEKKEAVESKGKAEKKEAKAATAAAHIAASNGLGTSSLLKKLGGTPRVTAAQKKTKEAQITHTNSTDGFVLSLIANAKKHINQLGNASSASDQLKNIYLTLIQLKDDPSYGMRHDREDIIQKIETAANKYHFSLKESDTTSLVVKDPSNASPEDLIFSQGLY